MGEGRGRLRNIYSGAEAMPGQRECDCIHHVAVLTGSRVEGALVWIMSVSSYWFEMCMCLTKGRGNTRDHLTELVSRV